MIKNNHKKIVLLLAIVLCLVGLLALSSCGDEVTDIYVASQNNPRLTYVQGQDLDLSTGILTIVLDGAEEKVPLSSEEVTISGYNSNTLGSQTLTITYGELTTSITVNVIPRMVAEGFETNYFVGDEFNKEMGKLKIANDDATTYYVNMKDNRVTLKSFDSKTAGTKSVTVGYSYGSASYECSFNVTVYEHSSVTFTAPAKIFYQSHNETIDVTGGYFTIRSADGKLSKKVNLKESMIQEFSFDDVTIENRKTAKSKLITVEYSGQTFTFEIKVTFSAISVVNYYANGILADIDWPSDPGELASALTEEQAEAALDAINTYVPMIADDKKQISQSVKQTVARAATVVAYARFLDELDSVKETFVLTEKLSFLLQIADYETYAATAEKLSSANSQLNVLAALLRNLESEFGSVTLATDTTIEDYVGVYSKEYEDNLAATLNHMVTIHKMLTVPEGEWTLEQLEAYAKQIEEVTDRIVDAKYYSIASKYYDGGGEFYNTILNTWRQEQDFFDILWSYHIYVKKDFEYIRANLFGRLPMPELVEAWYKNLNDAMYLESFYSQNWSTSAALHDVSSFMYFYFATLESIDAIKNYGDQFAKDIYEAFNGDYSTRYYLYTSDYGYLYHVGALIDNADFNAFWTTYYDVMKLYLADALDTQEHEELLVTLLSYFQKLSPAELYGFLGSLNLMYDSIDRVKMDEGGRTDYYYMLGFKDDTAYSVFADLLKDYYPNYLTDNNRALLSKLLLAMENYAISSVHPVALEKFNTLMAELKNEFNALSTGDQENFRSYFGTSYDQYLAIYELSGSDNKNVLTDEERILIEKLQTILVYFANAKTAMDQDPNASTAYYGLFFSLYAEAKELYTEFLSIASDEAEIYFKTVTFDFYGDKFTTDIAYYMVDLLATNILVNAQTQLSSADNTIVYVTAWDLFNDYEVDKLLAEMWELYYSALDPEAVTLTDEYVKSIIARVCGLNTLQLQILQYLGAADPYYGILDMYLDTKLSEESSLVSSKLLEAAWNLSTLSKEENKAKFLELMEEVIAAYDTLTEEEQSFLDAIYDICMTKYNELTTEA